MAEYTTRAVWKQDRQYDNQVDDFAVAVDFDRKAAPSAGQMLLVSLASCKLVSFLDLRRKHGMDIQHAEIEVRGVTGKGEPIEGTRYPSFRFLRIDYVFKVRTDHSEEELLHYLKFVNGACTVGNSISDRVEQTYSFQRI